MFYGSLFNSISLAKQTFHFIIKSFVTFAKYRSNFFETFLQPTMRVRSNFFRCIYKMSQEKACFNFSFLTICKQRIQSLFSFICLFFNIFVIVFAAHNNFFFARLVHSTAGSARSNTNSQKIFNIAVQGLTFFIFFFHKEIFIAGAQHYSLFFSAVEHSVPILLSVFSRNCLTGVVNNFNFILQLIKVFGVFFIIYIRICKAADFFGIMQHSIFIFQFQMIFAIINFLFIFNLRLNFLVAFQNFNGFIKIFVIFTVKQALFYIRFCSGFFNHILCFFVFKRNQHLIAGIMLF